MRRVVRVAAYTAGVVGLGVLAALGALIVYYAVHPSELIDVLGG